MEMLSEELNLRLSQVTDSLMNILQVQITRTINSAINDRVIPEIQNAIGTLSSGQRDTESGSSPNIQEDREGSESRIHTVIYFVPCAIHLCVDVVIYCLQIDSR